VLDGLALVADRKGISPAAAAKSSEVAEEIKRRLLGAGVDPAKVEEIAAAALAGAVARLGVKQAARDELLGL
jgi:type IV pilus biogenesis protein CpaD/CtpE